MDKLTKILPIANNVASERETNSILSSDSEVAAAKGGTKIDSKEISKHNEFIKFGNLFSINLG